LARFVFSFGYSFLGLSVLFWATACIVAVPLCFCVGYLLIVIIIIIIIIIITYGLVRARSQARLSLMWTTKEFCFNCLSWF
ncbi:MAG: hypothetical protein N7Q72_01865, partial [Spiroplasma sp. Tabriz.8]|nr:hypothetical protein [Spiroplasma sp. Tabriz.8]